MTSSGELTAAEKSLTEIYAKLHAKRNAARSPQPLSQPLKRIKAKKAAAQRQQQAAAAPAREQPVPTASKTQQLKNNAAVPRPSGASSSSSGSNSSSSSSSSSEPAPAAPQSIATAEQTAGASAEETAANPAAARKQIRRKKITKTQTSVAVEVDDEKPPSLSNAPATFEPRESRPPRPRGTGGGKDRTLLFVENILPDVMADELKMMFAAYGGMNSLRYLQDKGVALVQYEDKDVATLVRQELCGAFMVGSVINVLPGWRHSCDPELRDAEELGVSFVGQAPEDHRGCISYEDV
eukprot:g60255.t1